MSERVRLRRLICVHRNFRRLAEPPMFNFYSPAELSLPSRRRFLQEAGLGFGSLALAGLLNDELQSAPPAADPLALKPSHFPGKVKSIIWLFMTGAPSQ